MGRSKKAQQDAAPTPAPTMKRAAIAPSVVWPSGGGMHPPAGARARAAAAAAPTSSVQNAPTVPTPPVAPPPAPPAPAPPPPAPPPIVAAPPPAPPPFAPEPQIAPQTNTSNAWAALVAERAARGQRAQQGVVPQGEMLLVHAWAQVLYVQQVPAQACSIWLRRTEPTTECYEFYIPGETVGSGTHPDRQLHDYVDARRGQPSIREKFIGRIRAMLPDGTMIDVGAGEIDLMPHTAASRQPQGANLWGPQAPQWGNGSPVPQGTPSPYGPSQPAGAAPPASVLADPVALAMWNGMQQQNATLLKAVIERTGAPPPPAAVQADPVASQMWSAMVQQNEMLMRHMLERPAAAAAPAVQAAPAGGLNDAFALLDRVLGLNEKIKAAGAAPAAPIERIRNVDGVTVFTDKEGDIDVTATSVFGAFKEVKDIAKTVVAARSAGGGMNGAHPPKGIIAAAAAKANGTKQ